MLAVVHHGPRIFKRRPPIGPPDLTAPATPVYDVAMIRSLLSSALLGLAACAAPSGAVVGPDPRASVREEVGEKVGGPAMDATPRPSPVMLWGGAVLEQRQGAVVLVKDGEVVQTVRGALSDAPAASADGRVVALSVTEGVHESLLTFSLRSAHAAHEENWELRAWIQGDHTVTRLGMDAAGERLAFVWPGPKGGVAAVYLLDLGDVDAAPQRLTNRSPRVPGQPPADFVPLPLREPPFFDGPMLRWTAEDGVHAVEAR